MSERELLVPVVEERVRVDTRLVDSGVVKISTSVRENKEIVRAALMREEVEIKRVPMDEEVERVPDIRREDNLLIIPVVEERATVIKRLVLVEELHILRKVVHEEAEIPVDVRATRVNVQRETLPSDPQPSQVQSGDSK